MAKLNDTTIYGRLITTVDAGIATISTPAARLEVVDAGTASGVIVKITQDDGAIQALIIGNDTYSTDDAVGLRMNVSNGGYSYIESTDFPLVFNYANNKDVWFWKNSGGTYSGNIRFVYNDQLPTLRWYEADTAAAQLQYNGSDDSLHIGAIRTANASDLYMASEDKIYFQDYNGGSESTKIYMDMQNGVMSIGADTTSTYTLNIRATTAANNARTFFASSVPVFASSGSFTQYVAQMYNYPLISTGTTITGTLYGVAVGNLRNFVGAGSDDGGFLSGSLYGLNITNGHYNTNAAATPTTTSLVGLYIKNYYYTGTVTQNIYDILLAAAGTGGTLSGTYYGIYQEAGAAQNYFGGVVRLAASQYLNWGSIAGESGYGFRDNAGVLEYKHSGGDWATVSGGGSTEIGNPLNIGVNDTTSGVINLYGSSNTDGGSLNIYTAANYDGTIDYYKIRVNEDDLIIGINTNTTAFKYSGTDAWWEFDVTGQMRIKLDAFNQLIAVGVDNGGVGQFYLYGAGAVNVNGGLIRIYTAADHDGTIDYYTIRVYEDDIEIGPNTDQDALKLDANKDLYLTDGDFYVQEVGTTKFSVITGAATATIRLGQDDTVPGQIFCYGKGTGSTVGGLIDLYLAADYDGSIINFRIAAVEDDLLIGPNTDTDALKLDADKNFNITAGNLSIPVGNIGLNTYPPVYKIDIIDGLALNTTDKVVNITASGIGTASLATGHYPLSVSYVTSAVRAPAQSYSARNIYNELFLQSGSVLSEAMGIYMNLTIQAGGKAENYLYGTNTNITNSSSATSGTLVIYGSYISASSTIGTISTIIGDYANVFVSGSAVCSSLYGASFTASNSSSTAVPTVYGMNAAALNGGAGSVTNMYGAYILAQQSAGSVGTMYGCYINTAGTATTKWGLYVLGDGYNYLSGGLTVGTNTLGYGKKLTVYHTASENSGNVYNTYNYLSQTGLSLTAGVTAYNTYTSTSVQNIENNGYAYSLYGNYFSTNLAGSGIVNASYGIFNTISTSNTIQHTGATYGLYNSLGFSATTDAPSDIRGIYNISTVTATGVVIPSNYGYDGLMSIMGHGSATNVYAVNASILINSATAVNTGYLFKGNYQGKQAVNNWGMYLTNELRNYMSGDLGLGQTSPTYKLHILDTANTASSSDFSIYLNGSLSSITLGSAFFQYGMRALVFGNAVNPGGFQYDIIGIDSYARAISTTSGSNLIGINSLVETANTARMSSIFAITGNVSLGGTGDVNNINGAYMSLSCSAATTIPNAYGYRAIISGFGTTIVDARGVDVYLNRTAGVAQTGYLYYGSYNGTWTTQWGIYLSGATQNQLSGNLLLQGTDRYLNFFTTLGVSGYGIRDNNGIVECKDSGGSWASVSGSRNPWIIGINDVTFGQLYIHGHGTGSANGGLISLYTAADYDTSINYYGIRAYQDDLEIGPDLDLDALRFRGDTWIWEFTYSGTPHISLDSPNNTISVGVNDSGEGKLRLYGDVGGSADGGSIWLYTGADYDASIDYFRIEVNQDDLTVGPVTDPDAFMYTGNDSTWRFTQGSVVIGVDDTVRGVLNVYGHGAGTTDGGYIRIYNAADHDGSVDSYFIGAVSGDLYVGPGGDTDALKLDVNKDLYITAGSLVLPNSEYVNFSGTLGAGGYGIRDNAGVMEYKDYGGSWTTFASLSDVRLKTGITRSNVGLDFIVALNPVRFEYKNNLGIVKDGLIAQEVREVMNNLGVEFSGWEKYYDDSETQVLHYGDFIMPLINAIKDQQKIIKGLEFRIGLLESAV